MSGTEQNFIIRQIGKEDKAQIEIILRDNWGAVRIVSRGKFYNAVDYPGIVTEINNKIAGLLIYRIENDEMEILTLNSLHKNLGIGAGLLKAAEKEATRNDCKRLWLITTNDNTRALRFYQKRGFHLTAIYPNAMDESRKLKSEIPLIGNDGIPIRDEIELELSL